MISARYGTPDDGVGNPFIFVGLLLLVMIAAALFTRWRHRRGR